MTERHASLFRNGRNQAVRIPREFEMEGTEVLIRKEGDRLILTPIRKDRLLDLLASWEPLDEGLPDVEASPPHVNGGANPPLNGDVLFSGMENARTPRRQAAPGAGSRAGCGFLQPGVADP